eukprot:CAMPEP_0119189642 /NCGR_PEP_ID=MMETSP1316-20130426/906_1 /TAXON_ID=41880 /ORGANISM="Pycnococcus provasolii, Strain RCC2336" /LENGTH=189 /DNA_ID=CAMNT_0007184319 /DNA_START=148 /DNA_END=718 /DNA_ORIENTATION=+
MPKTSASSLEEVRNVNLLNLRSKDEVVLMEPSNFVRENLNRELVPLLEVKVRVVVLRLGNLTHTTHHLQSRLEVAQLVLLPDTQLAFRILRDGPSHARLPRHFVRLREFERLGARFARHALSDGETDNFVNFFRRLDDVLCVCVPQNIACEVALHLRGVRVACPNVPTNVHVNVSPIACTHDVARAPPL